MSSCICVGMYLSRYVCVYVCNHVRMCVFNFVLEVSRYVMSCNATQCDVGMYVRTYVYKHVLSLSLSGNERVCATPVRKGRCCTFHQKSKACSPNGDQGWSQEEQIPSASEAPWGAA